MDKLIDYTKYTIALGAGLLLYIQGNFIPAPNLVVWIYLVCLITALAFSVACGILLYTRVTRILIENGDATEDKKGHTRRWGSLHLWSLLIAFVSIIPYFLYQKVWAPTSKAECSIELPLANGEAMKLTFSCNAVSK